MGGSVLCAAKATDCGGSGFDVGLSSCKTSSVLLRQYEKKYNPWSSHKEPLKLYEEIET